MRIAFILPKLDGGGAERGSLGWAEGLADLNHDITLLTHEGGSGGAAPVGMRHLHRGDWSGPAYWSGLPRWIREMHAVHRFDVVVAVMEFSNLAVLAAFPATGRRSPALVLTEHNINSMFLSGSGSGARAKLLLSRRLYRRADAVVAISHTVATDITVRFGVDPRRLFVVPIPASNWQSTLTVDSADALRLVLVGRLTKQKRPERLVETLDELRRRGRPASATVVGDGPLRQELEQQVRLADHDVRFTGWVPDWREDARDASCLFLPSDYEGLGLVLLEAASMGLPCVAPSQALAVAEAMIPGVTGVLALSSRAEHLADAVVESLNLRRGQLDAHDWLVRFSPAATARQLEAVCAKTVSDMMSA